MEMQKPIKSAAWPSAYWLAASLVAALCSLDAGADAFGHAEHAYPYSPSYLDRRPGMQQEVDRLRGQMRRQERRLVEQTRLQREQSQLLRKQTLRRQQVSALQACYYRFDAGLDLCDDLFAAASPERADCHEKVTQKNPACAQDGRQLRPSRGD